MKLLSCSSQEKGFEFGGFVAWSFLLVGLFFWVVYLLVTCPCSQQVNYLGGLYVTVSEYAA